MSSFLAPSERDTLTNQQIDTTGMAQPVGSLMGAVNLLKDTSPMAAFIKHPSVRKVTDFIAGNIASIPLHAYQHTDEGRDRVRTGALAQVLTKPSVAREETRYMFWKRVILDWLLWDVALVFVDTKEAVLRRVPPQRWLPEVNGMGVITAINVVADDGNTYRFDPDRFLILAGYSTPNSAGTSPIDTLQQLLNETSAALDFRQRMLDRQATHTGVVQRESAWDSETSRDNFLEGLREFDQVSERQGGTMLLDEGMTWVDRKPAYTPSDLDDIEARRLTDIEVASMFHIAPEMLGIRQGNYSNMEAFRQSLYRDNLGPYIDGWEQAVAPLVQFFGEENMYIEAFMDAKLRGSFDEQAKSFQMLVGAPVMSRNEARAKMNLPNIDGGDELITPLNVLVGGQASPSDVDSHNPFLGDYRNTHPTLKEGPNKSIKSWEATPEWAEKAGVLVTEFLGRQARAVKAAYDANEEWWDTDRWNKELGADLTALAIEASADIGYMQTRSLGEPETAYTPELTVNYLTAMGEGRAELINQKTLVKLTEALNEGKTVEEFYKETSVLRGLTIGAAFVAAVSSWTAREVADQVMGGVGAKTWIVTSSNPRPSHAAQDRVTIGLDETFPNGQSWPGDPSMGPDENAGCMCGVEVTWIS